MATNRQTAATVPEAVQPEQAMTKAPELLDIGVHREKHKVGRAVFAGVCAARDWKPGKAVTEAEFLAAVASFTGAPIGPVKSAKESEAKK